MSVSRRGLEVLREGLRKSPRNGFMLYGLAEALKAQKKDASEVEREMEKARVKADVRLSLNAL